MGRSLELVEISADKDGRPVLSCLCDCGTVTAVIFAVAESAAAEVAYTCDGCQSSHWMTVTAGDSRG
jgi:hypothetical protein